MAVQIVIGAVLIAVSLASFMRTRQLVIILADLESRPLSATHKDRVTSIVFVHQLVSALTLLAGFALFVLAALG